MSVLPTIFVDRALPPGFETLFEGRAHVVGPAPQALGGADAVVAGASPWDAARIAAGSSLRCIARAGIGYDSVDLEAATARGVVVCNAPDAPTVSTAEHAVALLLAAAKRLSICQQRLRAGPGDYFGANDGLELAGRTLGLVGYGRIARRVGVVAAALDMEIIAHDPYVGGADVELVGFDTLLARADVISVHAPLTAETRHLLDAQAFAAMKRGAVLVNAARGGLVDHEALLAALDSGHLFAAALDVTDPEPLPPNHPLLSRDDVLVTPHIASATDRGKRRLYDHAIANALMVLRGERVPDCVNPEVYDTS